ncbi:MAG: Cys-tRNA(Pro) deacylase [Anaerovorax sp.]|nr:Cys-tRNA(Pro) deacylase [Anaerovorax sp.]
MAKTIALKTNALRLLDAKKIQHQIYTYDAPEGFLDGISVAKATGQNQDQVFKTLVTQGTSKEHYVCVIPVACELDLKKAAKYFGEKKIEMIPAKDITNITGYIKGGCSPVGMKKLFQTAIDKKAAAFDTIIVSGGRVGLQMELPVQSLCELTKAQLVDLTVE